MWRCGEDEAVSGNLDVPGEKRVVGSGAWGFERINTMTIGHSRLRTTSGVSDTVIGGEEEKTSATNLGNTKKPRRA